MSPRTTRRSAVAAALLVVPAVLGTATHAQADPPGDPFVLDCGEDGTVEVAVAGNGQFTPGHLVGSTAMLIPTAFGEFTGTATTADGEVLESFVEPATVKTTRVPPHAQVLECSIDFTETFEDPEHGLVTFSGSGSVTAFLTPAGR